MLEMNNIGGISYYVRKVVVLGVVAVSLFVCGWFGHYFLATPKVVTHETVKTVVKYIKADQIHIGADGSVDANGNASLEDSESTKVKDKEITNMASNLLQFGTKVNFKGIGGYDGRIQHDFIGKFGAYTGLDYYNIPVQTPSGVSFVNAFYINIGVSWRF
jgi:hypothetical protein